jgi:hypothetical protein
MKKILLFAISFAFIISCQTEKEKIHSQEAPPKPKINETQFINLLIDIHTADSYLGNFQTEFSHNCKKNHLDKVNAFQSLYGSIFKKHGIDQKDFFDALNYYSFHQDELLKIYEQVIDRLNLKKDSIQFVKKKT